MTVGELIEKLDGYNQDAKLSVIVHCKKENFSLSCGGGEGVENHNADTVSFYVDRLCGRES